MLKKFNQIRSMWFKCSESLPYSRKNCEIMLEDHCITTASWKFIKIEDDLETSIIWKDEFDVIRYPIYWREIY